MPRKQYKYHYIYKTTNTINDNFYIGMHSTYDLTDGYQGSGKRLWWSINRYGKEKHVTEILEYLPDRESLKKREAEIVNEELINEELCMNLVIGGNGGFDIINKNSKVQSWKGIRGGIRQKWLFENDPIWVAKRAENLSISGKLAYLEGRNIPHPPDCTGEKHTEKTKQKMRDAKKGKYLGEKNSQFGTKWAWINNNGNVLKVKYEEHIKYLGDGWKRGTKPDTVKPEFINTCKNCNDTFTSKRINTKYCSKICISESKPNKIRDNFEMLHLAYTKHGSLCKAFKICGIIRSSTGYKTFYDILGNIAPVAE